MASQNGTSPMPAVEQPAPEQPAMPHLPDGARLAAVNQRNEKLRQDLRATEDNQDLINAYYISEQNKTMMLTVENQRLHALLTHHGIDPNEVPEPKSDDTPSEEASG